MVACKECKGDENVVSVQQRSRYRFSDSVNVNRRSGKERSDETRGGREKGGEHQSSEPPDVQTVVRAGDPVGETLPSARKVGNLTALLEVHWLERADTQLSFEGALSGKIVRDKLQRRTNSTTHAAAVSGSGLRDVEGLTAGGHQGYNDAKSKLHGINVQIGLQY